MATDINSVILIGRLVRDPEIKIINTTSLASFTIASNRTYSYSGERREETLFIDCTAWAKLSEIVKQYCIKGKQVCVSGRLKQNIWKNQEGQTQSKIEIVVENLQLLGGGQFGAKRPDEGSSVYKESVPNRPMGSYPKQDGNYQSGAPATGGAAQENQKSDAVQEEFTEDDIPF